MKKTEKLNNPQSRLQVCEPLNFTLKNKELTKKVVNLISKTPDTGIEYEFGIGGKDSYKKFVENFYKSKKTYFIKSIFLYVHHPYKPYEARQLTQKIYYKNKKGTTPYFMFPNPNQTQECVLFAGIDESEISAKNGNFIITLLPEAELVIRLYPDRIKF